MSKRKWRVMLNVTEDFNLNYSAGEAQIMIEEYFKETVEEGGLKLDRIEMVEVSQ